MSSSRPCRSASTPGSAGSPTTAFAVGAQVVLMNYLLPGEVVKLCARHRVTGLTCVPPLWLQLIGLDWPAEATASLRYFARTGGRMPRSTLDRLRQTFPRRRRT
jgi:acyl-CoA synthetase (AMP-forming)/AMP-acid ligase II